MLAKVIAWGRDRAEAVTRLCGALGDTAVLGVVTNVPFLRALVDDADVRAGRIDTGLISRLLERAGDADTDATPPPEVLAAATLLIHDEAWRRGSDAPWSRPTGWRLGRSAPVRRTFVHRGAEFAVELVGTPEAAVVRIGDGDALRVRLLDRSGDRMLVECDGRTFGLLHARSGDTVWLARTDGAVTAAPTSPEPGGPWALRLLPGVRSAADRGAHAQASDAAADPQLRSPMPGTVVSIEVADGDAVEAGTGILVIEAMKMEHRVAAPLAGIVHLAVRVGEHVAGEHPLAVIEPLVPTRDEDDTAPTQGGTPAAHDRRAIPTTEGRS
jgi:acetyl-CoA/propionyl-CoA carboxylase biotin carboxyl carrier protein